MTRSRCGACPRANSDTTGKTALGVTGRVIPLNDTAVATLEDLAARVPKRAPEHFIFASERYGLAGDAERDHSYAPAPTVPMHSLKEAWESAKRVSGVVCRFHDLRRTAATRMLEAGVRLVVVASILGWSPSTTTRMARRYGHIGNAAQREAVEILARESSKAAEGGVGKESGALRQRLEELIDAKLLKEMAPRAGFEPATLRLTEDDRLVDQVRLIVTECVEGIALAGHKPNSAALGRTAQQAVDLGGLRHTLRHSGYTEWL